MFITTTLLAASSVEQWDHTVELLIAVLTVGGLLGAIIAGFRSRSKKDIREEASERREEAHEWRKEALETIQLHKESLEAVEAEVAKLKEHVRLNSERAQKAEDELKRLTPFASPQAFEALEKRLLESDERNAKRLAESEERNERHHVQTRDELKEMAAQTQRALQDMAQAITSAVEKLSDAAVANVESFNHDN